MDLSYEIEPRLFAGAVSCVSPHSATSPSGGENTKGVSFEPDGSIWGTDGKRILRAKGAYNGMMTFAPFFLFFDRKLTIPKNTDKLQLRIYGLVANLIPDPGTVCEASLSGDTRKWAGTVKFRQPDPSPPGTGWRWGEILARQLRPTRIPEEDLDGWQTAFDPVLLGDVAKALGAIGTQLLYRPLDGDCISVEARFLPAEQFSRVRYVQAYVR